MSLRLISLVRNASRHPTAREKLARASWIGSEKTSTAKESKVLTGDAGDIVCYFENIDCSFNAKPKAPALPSSSSSPAMHKPWLSALSIVLSSVCCPLTHSCSSWGYAYPSHHAAGEALLGAAAPIFVRRQRAARASLDERWGWCAREWWRLGSWRLFSSSVVSV